MIIWKIMDSSKIFNTLGNIEDIIVYDKYRDIWNDVSSDVQNRKANRLNMTIPFRTVRSLNLSGFYFHIIFLYYLLSFDNY